MNEFVIEWIKGGNYAGVTVPSGTALKSKLIKYAESHPGECKLMAENQDGSAFFHVPIKWVKLSPPRHVSEEQRRLASERFRSYHASKEN